MLSARCGHRAQWERSVQKIASAVDYLVCSNYLKTIRDIFVGSYSAKSAWHRERGRILSITSLRITFLISSVHLTQSSHCWIVYSIQVIYRKCQWLPDRHTGLCEIGQCSVWFGGVLFPSMQHNVPLLLSSSQDWVCAAPNLLSIILVWRSTWYNCNSKMQTTFFSQFYFNGFKNLF